MRTIANRNFPIKTKVRKGKGSQSVDTFNAESRKSLEQEKGAQALTAGALNAVNLAIGGVAGQVSSVLKGIAATPARASTPALETEVGDNSSQKMLRRGDFEPKASKRHSSIDYTTTYLPNGQARQRSPINKNAMAWQGVIHVKKWSGPTY